MSRFSFSFYNPFGWFPSFNWGSVFKPYTPPVIKSVALTPNQAYTALSSDIIKGTTGIETVTLAKGITKVSIDSKVENINLAGGLFDYSLQGAGQKVSINTGAFRTNVATVQPSVSGTHLTFADGSQVTLSLGGYGNAQIHYDTVQLLDNKTTTVGNGDIVIKGGNGDETLQLNPGLYHVTADHKVESLVLSQSYMDSQIVTLAGQVQVEDTSDNPVVTWDINAGETHTLQFDNAVGRVTLGTDGNAVFNLTDIYLDSGESYIADASGISIHGMNTSNWWFLDQPRIVILTDDVRDIYIDDGIQEVELSSGIDSYQYQDVQGELKIFDSSGNTLVTLQIPQDNQGIIIQLGDTQYQAVEGRDGLYLNDMRVATSAPEPLTAPAPAPVSTTPTDGASAFDYTLALGNFGTYASKIETVLHKALDDIGQYVAAKGSFDISVEPEQTRNTVLAEASPATVATPADLSSQLSGASTSSVFQVESLSGVDPNGSQPDATLYINMAHAASFNFDPNLKPGANQYDLTSVLTHELVHALGFSGFLPDTATTSPFDQDISMQGGVPYFTGTEAEKVYGGAVPLAAASAGTGSAYYHVDLPGGSDLMSSSLGKGEVHSLSPLDLAILDDIGIQLVGSLPVTA